MKHSLKSIKIHENPLNHYNPWNHYHPWIPYPVANCKSNTLKKMREKLHPGSPLATLENGTSWCHGINMGRRFSTIMVNENTAWWLPSSKLTVGPWQSSGLEDECFHEKLAFFRVQLFIYQRVVMPIIVVYYGYMMGLYIDL